MLKRISLRKIAVTSCALFIIGLFYIFPTAEAVEYKIYNKEKIKTNACIYMNDKNNYVSLVNVNLKEKKLTDKLKESINLLKKDKDNFKSTINKDTKLLNIKIEEDTVTLNFDQYLLKTSDLENTIESIVYTMTEFKEISSVIILVNGKPINELYKGKLDRNIGINKIIDITSLENITKTTIYYVNNSEDKIYYTPVTKVSNNTEEKIAVIINELKSSTLYQSNLSSYLSNDAELKKYELEGKVMNLTFNDKIFDEVKSKKILEEVKYTIGKSIKDNYNVENVIFYVNDKEIMTNVSKTLEN